MRPEYKDQDPEDLKWINETIERWKVEDKYAHIQRYSEKQTKRVISGIFAIAIATGAVIWYLFSNL